MFWRLFKDLSKYHQSSRREKKEGEGDGKERR